MIDAVINGRVEDAKRLLKNGADPNARCQSTFDSALQIALRNYNYEIAQQLFECGANVNEQNSGYYERQEKGRTLLGFFVMTNNYDALDWLLERGADPNVSTSIYKKVFPLEYALDSKICKLLCDFGANPDIIDENGNLELMYNNAEFGRYVALIAAGANINATNREGLTPLHKAVENENINLITYLLALGADKGEKDSFGKKPLDYAISSEVAVLLNADSTSAITEVARQAEQKLGIAKTNLC